MKVLIVEDEAIIALEIESSLQNLGYEVTSVVDTGQKAIEKAETDIPDIILMDIRIKGELDGIETAEVIRSRFGIPVIFSTAYLDEKRIKRAKITMPFGYVLKPIQERDLRVTIEMALYVAKIDVKRKNAEEALKKNEEKFRLLYERAPLSYQSLDENGCFITINETWLNTLGYTEEEVIGKSFGDFIHPDWADHFKENFPRFKSMGEIIGVEFEMKKKDGSLILVSFDGKIGLNENGTFKQTHCILKDVTNVRRAEQALKESEQKFKQLVDNSIAGVYIVLENKVKYCNQRFAEMWGYLNPEEVVGLNIQSFVDETSISKVEEEISQRISTGNHISHYEVKCIKKNGDFFYAEVFGCSINYEGQRAAQGMVIDINKRKLAINALKRKDRFLEDIINSISHPFHVIDINTKIIKYASKATGRDAVGKTCYLATHNSQIPCDTTEHPCPVDIILKTKRPTVVRHVHTQPDGSEKLIEVHASPLFDDHGEVEFIVESNIDIGS